MKDEGFTVSTKSLDNIRSTILIFYGMEKIIDKCKDKICNNGECKCDTKPGNYTECLSLYSVCFNILKDISSMKDGTLPMAVTWLSNCLMFAGDNDKSSLSMDNNYRCRQSRYPIESGCIKNKVTKVAENYEKMIEKATELGKLEDEKKVNGNCDSLQSCTSTPEGSSTCSTTEKECNCPDQTCACENTLDTKDSVFKTLCGIMCCNQDGGTSGCTCSSSNPGNCQSIKSFCKEVKDFIALVKEVTNGTTAQEATPPTCNCTKEKNCEYCQTRRFIRLVEEYTKQLKTADCGCKPLAGTIVGVLYCMIRKMLSILGTEECCKCCVDKNGGNCLKDGYKCGITHVMKYFFCCNNCKCLDVSTAKSKKKRSAETKNSENGHKEALSDNDKLCKCLVKVFKQVAENLGICKNGEIQKCPCSCASDSDSCSCLKECCKSDKCTCPCKNGDSSGSTTLPLNTLHTTHHHLRITVIHFNISHSHSVK